MAINMVPMSTDVGRGGQDPLVQALGRRQQASPFARMQQAAQQPIASRAQGNLALATALLGGIGEGYEAGQQRRVQQQGAQSYANLLGTLGATPEQRAAVMGMYLAGNTDGANALLKSLVDRQNERPTFGVVGQDFMGRNQYGFIDPRTQTTTRANSGGGQQSAPAAMPQGGGMAAPAQQQAPAAQPGEDPARRAQATAAGYPREMPLPPPGVDLATFYKEQSERMTREAMPATTEFTNNLRGEFQRLPSIQRFNTVAPIFSSMVDSAAINSRASDLNFVYGLAKIFDPESVVREGEMGMVQATGSLPDQIAGRINAVISGGQSLTPAQRADLLQIAGTRVARLQEAAQNDFNRIRDIATRNRANPEDIVQPLAPLEMGRADAFRREANPEQYGPTEIPPAYRPQAPAPQAAPQTSAPPAPNPLEGIPPEVIQQELQRRYQLQQQQMQQQPVMPQGVP